MIEPHQPETLFEGPADSTSFEAESYLAIELTTGFNSICDLQQTSYSTPEATRSSSQGQGNGPVELPAYSPSQDFQLSEYGIFNATCDPPMSFRDRHRFLYGLYNSYPDPGLITAKEIGHVARKVGLLMEEVLEWFEDEKWRRTELLANHQLQTSTCQFPPSPESTRASGEVSSASSSCNATSPGTPSQSLEVVSPCPASMDQKPLAPSKSKRGRPAKRHIKTEIDLSLLDAKRKKVSVKYPCVDCSNYVAVERWAEHIDRKHFPENVWECPKINRRGKPCSSNPHYRPSYRHDNFATHLKGEHDCLDPEIAELKKSCKFEVTDFFHKVCGFCNRALESREKSIEHIKEHFMTISQTKNPPADLGASLWKENCGSEHKLQLGVHYRRSLPPKPDLMKIDQRDDRNGDEDDAGGSSKDNSDNSDNPGNHSSDSKSDSSYGHPEDGKSRKGNSDNQVRDNSDLPLNSNHVHGYKEDERSDKRILDSPGQDCLNFQADNNHDRMYTEARAFSISPPPFINIDILEASFRKNPKPPTQTKRIFAEHMGVDIARINNWFQNRRAKQKQEKKQEAYDAGEALLALGCSKPLSPSSCTHFNGDSPQYPDHSTASKEQPQNTVAVARVANAEESHVFNKKYYIPAHHINGGKFYWDPSKNLFLQRETQEHVPETAGFSYGTIYTASPQYAMATPELRAPSIYSTASGMSSTTGSPYSIRGYTVPTPELAPKALSLNPNTLDPSTLVYDAFGDSKECIFAPEGLEEFPFAVPIGKASFVDPSMLYPPPVYPGSPYLSQSSRSPRPVKRDSQSPYTYSLYPNSPPRRDTIPFHTSRDSFSGEESTEKGRCTYPECGKVFKDLKAHMLTHMVERPEKCPIRTCDYHIKGFARKYDKNRHTLTHYKGTMVCGFCPNSGTVSEKSFNRADVFKRHLTSVHAVEQTPLNSRRKAGKTNSDRTLSGYPPDATGTCSTCAGIFTNAQDFYEHLDDCVLHILQQEEPSEAINAARSAEVENDQVA